MSGMVAGTRPYFFVHVMKTAGQTLNNHIRANFATDEIYPGPGPAAGADYMVIERLHAAIEERGDEVRIWGGHFPFYVTKFVPGAVTMTLLRDPVSRTVSLLEQRRENRFPDKSIEELYEDPGTFEREIQDHQTKVFSMRADDEAPTWVHPILVDRSRLDDAKAAVESVDILGRQDRFDAFLRELSERWGWRIDDVDDVNVSRGHTASASFRRRIAEDNPLDMELYDHVCELVG